MSRPSKDFKFRTGRYQGKSYDFVLENNPNYIVWVKENQPKMLKEIVATVVKVKEEKKFGKITPNLNFDTQPVEWDLPFFKNKV